MTIAILTAAATIFFTYIKDIYFSKKEKVDKHILTYTLLENELSSIWYRFSKTYEIALKEYEDGGILAPFFVTQDYFTVFHRFTGNLDNSNNPELRKKIFLLYIDLKGFLDTCYQHHHFFKLYHETSNLISTVDNSSPRISSQKKFYFDTIVESSQVICKEYLLLEPFVNETINDLKLEIESLRCSPIMINS